MEQDRRSRYIDARLRALRLRESARLITSYCLVRGSSEELLDGLSAMASMRADWDGGLEVEPLIMVLNQCANEIFKTGDLKLAPFAEECERLARDLFSLMMECRLRA